jgi:hypothetical protein
VTALNAPIGIDPASAAPQRRRRARRAVVVAMLAGLLGAAGARHWAMSLQAQAAASSPYAVRAGAGAGKASSTIGTLDSYTMVLLLGGLRGPLVMYLWASSENQKNERDLEDFDTKVELIRQLQPEFVSVHLFQIWNKGYNISAQAPSLPAKYGIILDALEYGYEVDRGRPNDMNILLALNQMFQHKLGASGQDSVYYRRRIRSDTKYRPADPPLGVGVLRMRMDPMLGPDGNLLPKLDQPTTPRPAGLPARVRLPADREDRLRKVTERLGVTVPQDKILRSGDGRTVAWTISEPDAIKLAAALNPDDPANTWAADIAVILADWNDGSDFQYLRQYAPYRYGLGPLSIGYNYAKRAQVLLNTTGQKPAQYSRAVIDSKPPLELKGWGDEEFERGAIAEMTGLKAVVQPDWWAYGKLNREALEEARDAFGLSARVYADAVAEYARHLNRTDPTIGIDEDDLTPQSEGGRMRRLYSYDSHIEELKARGFMSRADKHLADAMLETDPVRRRDALKRARVFYGQAAYRAKFLELRYFTPGELLDDAFAPAPGMPRLPEGFGRPNVDNYFNQPRTLLLAHSRMMALLAVDWVREKWDQNSLDRMDTERIILRSGHRAAMIDKLLGEQVVTVGDDPFMVDGTYSPPVRVQAPAKAGDKPVPVIPPSIGPTLPGPTLPGPTPR